MKTNFLDFFNKYSKYKKFENNKEADYIFTNILSKNENIIKMIDMSDANTPALCACLPEIYNYYYSLNSPTFDLLNDYFARQALGTMVKFILEPFGYLKNSPKEIPKNYQPSIISSAMTYKYEPNIAKFKVVRSIQAV